jgi:hypothetical protein
MTTSMGDETVSSALLCEANKEGRTITFFIRENFADGTDGGGLPIGPDQERKQVHKILDQAIDVVIGLRRAVVPIERWAQVRYLAPQHEVESRD